MAATNGATSRRRLSDTHSHHAIAAVTAGTGAKNAMFGQENQRAAILASRNGVQMLTMAMNASTPNRHRGAMDVLSEDAALGEGGDERAPEERLVPALLGCPRGRPELERDAAEDETEQHREDREVERRQDDRERERKRGEERNPAEHEPGLVPGGIALDRKSTRLNS